MNAKNLFVKTPLFYSTHLSARLNADVYLKLENLQPCHSFKLRGISLFVQHILQEKGPSVHLVVASSGNAALATATVARQLGIRCSVVLAEGAGDAVLKFLQQQGADTRVAGKYYIEALKVAQGIIATDPNAILVPSYDHPLIWEGHASMITEIARQLPNGTKPDAIFCSVGGGGLLGGVLTGCKLVGWDDVTVVAAETTGSNCFYHTIMLNHADNLKEHTLSPGTTEGWDDEHRVKLAILSELSSRASSLGGSSPAPGVVKMGLDREGPIKCLCIGDEQAMAAALQFAEEHKMLVELACSTALAAGYTSSLFNQLVPARLDEQRRSVVFIVDGGFKVSLSELAEYQELVAADTRERWDVLYDGKQQGFDKE